MKPSVSRLVERHNATYDKCNAIWDAQAVSELCDLHDDLFNAAPASIVEFFAKWRQVAKFEAELADPAAGIIEPADVITAMLDELQVLPGR
jgi:hypothetical protein